MSKCDVCGTDHGRGLKETARHLTEAHERIREMVMHGYDPNEHPFVVKQAIRILALEARVKELETICKGRFTTLDRVVRGGGRESGGTAGVTEDESPRQGTPAAAYPAARCDACWEGRSHTHAARKEASP